MDSETQFSFRNTHYFCKTYVDSSAHPCYVFVILLDNGLIHEFGEELTIKTDCEKLLPRTDDHPRLVALRQAIFDSLKKTPELLLAQQQYQQLITKPRQV